MRDNLRKAMDEIEKNEKEKGIPQSFKSFLELLKEAAESGAVIEIKGGKNKKMPQKLVNLIKKLTKNNDYIKLADVVDKNFNDIARDYVLQVLEDKEIEQAQKSKQGMQACVFSMIMGFMLTILEEKLITINKKGKK